MRTNKWKAKRELIDQMNKSMRIFDYLRMTYELPSYRPKHAREFKCI